LFGLPTFIFGQGEKIGKINAKREQKSRFCPLFLGFCPLLKTKLGTLKARRYVVCGLSAHFPTFFFN
jgi:hypothetical protein